MVNEGCGNKKRFIEFEKTNEEENIYFDVFKERYCKEKEKEIETLMNEIKEMEKDKMLSSIKKDKGKTLDDVKFKTIIKRLIMNTNHLRFLKKESILTQKIMDKKKNRDGITIIGKSFVKGDNNNRKNNSSRDEHWKIVPLKYEGENKSKIENLCNIFLKTADIDYIQKSKGLVFDNAKGSKTYKNMIFFMDFSPSISKMRESIAKRKGMPPMKILNLLFGKIRVGLVNIITAIGKLHSRKIALKRVDETTVLILQESLENLTDLRITKCDMQLNIEECISNATETDMKKNIWEFGMLIHKIFICLFNVNDELPHKYIQDKTCYDELTGEPKFNWKNMKNSMEENINRIIEKKIDLTNYIRDDAFIYLVDVLEKTLNKKKENRIDFKKITRHPFFFIEKDTFLYKQDLIYNMQVHKILENDMHKRWVSIITKKNGEVNPLNGSIRIYDAERNSCKEIAKKYYDRITKEDEYNGLILLTKKIFLNFVGETGIDNRGVTNDFMNTYMDEVLMKSDMFEYDEDEDLFYVSDKEVPKKKEKLFNEQYEIFGFMLRKCFIEEIVLNQLKMDSFFFDFLCDNEYSRSINWVVECKKNYPTFYNGLKKLFYSKNSTIKSLDLYIRNIKDGHIDSIPVSKENVRDYVYIKCRERMLFGEIMIDESGNQQKKKTVPKKSALKLQLRFQRMNSIKRGFNKYNQKMSDNDIILSYMSGHQLKLRLSGMKELNGTYIHEYFVYKESDEWFNINQLKKTRGFIYALFCKDKDFCDKQKNLETFLIWVTGMRTLPTLKAGSKRIIVKPNNGPKECFYGKTCNRLFYVPTFYEDYEDFKKKFFQFLEYVPSSSLEE